MEEKDIHNGRCLTLEDRISILTGIINGSTLVKIAEYVHKDPSAIKKEIVRHRTLSYKCKYPVPCAKYADCKIRTEYPYNCRKECEDYVEFRCLRRDRTPGACDGCDNLVHCKYDKYRYKPKLAEESYEAMLVESRKGTKQTTDSLKKIGTAVSKELENGKSPQTMTSNDITVSWRTIYRYAHDPICSRLMGISLVDFRVVVSRKPNKNSKADDTPKQIRKNTEGHTYVDFCAYVEEHPDTYIAEMDTVYNSDPGPYMQTFLIREYGMLIGVYRESRTADDMVNGVDTLEEWLGDKLFAKYFSIILTDRGSEFSNLERLEYDADGVRRAQLFYCDPQRPTQKPALERKHEILRFILPKKADLRELGLNSQEDLNLVISHVDSYPMPTKHGKSPLEMIYENDPELYDVLNKVGIQFIDSDELILTPKLLKNKNKDK